MRGVIKIGAGQKCEQDTTVGTGLLLLGDIRREFVDRAKGSNLG
jgi:hypothetical protein